MPLSGNKNAKKNKEIQQESYLISKNHDKTLPNDNKSSESLKQRKESRKSCKQKSDQNRKFNSYSNYIYYFLQNQILKMENATIEMRNAVETRSTRNDDVEETDAFVHVCVCMCPRVSAQSRKYNEDRPK